MSKRKRTSRIGGLAVVAYLGVAVATGQGVASADSTDSESTPAASDATPASDASPDSASPGTTPAGAASDSDSPSTAHPADTVKDPDPRTGIVRSSGGAHTGTYSTTPDASTEPATESAADTGDAADKPTATTEQNSSAPVPAGEPTPRHDGSAPDEHATRALDPVGKTERPEVKPVALSTNRQRATAAVEPTTASRVAPTATATAVDDDPVTAAVAPAAVDVRAAVTAPAVIAPPAPVAFIAGVLAAFGLNPLAAGGGPIAPAAPPTLWAVLAWVRRQIQVTFFNQTPTAHPVQTSQSATGLITGTVGAVDPDGDRLQYNVTAPPSQGSVVVDANGSYVYTPSAALALTGGTDTFTVSVDDHTGFHLHLFGGTGQISVPVTVTVAKVNVSPEPSAPPTVGDPDSATGAVRGSLNVRDANGDPLTYTVTSPPTYGRVTIDAAGNFTYTPTTAARLRLAALAGLRVAAVDTFTVAVSDGELSTPVTVTTTVRPATLMPGTEIVTGDGPTNLLTLPDGRVYISNYVDETITVYDPATGTTSTITTPGLGTPGPAQVSPDGGTVYLRTSPAVKPDFLSLYRASDNTLITTIQLPGTPVGGSAIDGSGAHLYLSSNEGVVVVDTATLTASTISTSSAVGSVAVTPDGGRLYVTLPSANAILVLDPATGANLGSFLVGTLPLTVRMSPDGTRAFVTNYGVEGSPGTVSVLDTDTASATYNTVIATVPQDIAPLDAVFSPDGSVAYVTNGPGVLKVVDTATNEVIQTVPLAYGYTQSIAVSPDGSTVYVGASNDDRVIVLNLA